MPLSSIERGVTVRIERLPSHPVLMQRLGALGVRPGAEVQVLRRGRPGGILHVACGFVEFMLRDEHAREIRVHPCG